MYHFNLRWISSSHCIHDWQVEVIWRSLKSFSTRICFESSERKGGTRGWKEIIPHLCRRPKILPYLNNSAVRITFSKYLYCIQICVGVIPKKSPNSTYIYFRKYDFYETIPEVRERMAELASKRLCKDVKAIYFFDMLGKQIYLDYVHRVRQNKSS